MSGRRRSIFEETGSGGYKDKLQEEVQQYLTFLDENVQNSKSPPEHVKLSVDEMLAIKRGSSLLPDLDEYVKTAEEFLKKDVILHKKREQLKGTAENLIFRTL